MFGVLNMRGALVLLSVATILSGCETVPLAPGAAQVRFTSNPADVASCKAVGNVAAGCSSDGQIQTFEPTIRNRTIGVGGNTVFVTRESLGIACEGVAYDCR